jgi:hypothetical protein
MSVCVLRVHVKALRGAWPLAASDGARYRRSQRAGCNTRFRGWPTLKAPSGRCFQALVEDWFLSRTSIVIPADAQLTES